MNRNESFEMSNIAWKVLSLLFVFLIGTGCYRSSNSIINQGEPIRTLEEWQSLGKTEPVRHIVCSGSGTLRLITYLDAAEKVIAVEQTEKQSNGLATYRLFHPEYADLPVFGEGHGRDNIEFLLNENPKPDIIIRIDNPGTGIDPRLLQERVGIPVIIVPYGDLGNDRDSFNQSIRLLGEILGKQERAESLIHFIDDQINELRERIKAIPTEKRPTVFLGGLSYRGTHGINSTMIVYPPFDWLHLNSPASELKSDAINANHLMISKEQLIVWNPDFLFIDLGTIGMGGSNGVTELKTQPIYASLNALKNKQTYALFPNNSYNTNFDAMLANAWFIGKTIYPEQFEDVKINQKVDEIFHFMLNAPLPNDSLLNICPERIKSSVYKTIFEPEFNSNPL